MKQWKDWKKSWCRWRPVKLMSLINYRACVNILILVTLNKLVVNGSTGKIVGSNVPISKGASSILFPEDLGGVLSELCYHDLDCNGCKYHIESQIVVYKVCFIALMVSRAIVLCCDRHSYSKTQMCELGEMCLTLQSQVDPRCQKHNDYLRSQPICDGVLSNPMLEKASTLPQLQTRVNI